MTDLPMLGGLLAAAEGEAAAGGDATLNLLITLIVTLYDRFRPIYSARLEHAVA